MDGLAPGSAQAGLRALIDAELAPLVHAIDHGGAYPAAALRTLGGAGLFGHHLAASAGPGGRSLGRAIEAMAAVAETCMSTAFCTWCQDACGWYLELSDNAALRDRAQPGLASGATLGGTGLSNPVKAVAGIEAFRLRATRASGGYVVSGVLPWVSNLGPGHPFGTVFEDTEDPKHRIMALVDCGQPGVEIRQSAHFIALEGTATYSVQFRRAFIAEGQVLADSAPELMRRVRPGFVLLQTGMGLGVIAAAIRSMRQADATHRSTNQFLPTRPDDIEAALHRVSSAVAALAETPTDTDPGYLRAVLQARLDVSELTLAATGADVLHGGARGYLEGSAVARRQREGNFVALITPSIRHLRMELAAMA